MNRGLRVLFAVVATALFALPASVEAQGVTTSTLTGRVTDESGAPLSNVEVVITNTSTGAQVQTLTRGDGRYLMPALRPGGPYRIEATSIGYQANAVEDVRLALGETRNVDITLSTQAVALEGIAVEGRRGTDVSGGVRTVVDAATIERAPTLNREIVDVARLTPQAFVSNEDDDGAAISIAGQNAEYNGLFIDGVVNNDVFGLSAQGTPGGQTGAPPISFDALEQMQIAISPFDVTQSGFTGGAINAITRSGTNEFTGSLYWQTRSATFAGESPGPDYLFGEDNPRLELPEFSNDRIGFRLGGPIVRNKLFFFVNGELFRSETPRPFQLTDYEGDSRDMIEDLRQIVLEETGYDAGDFGTKASTLDDNKVLAKIDWSINDDHRMSLRHSYSQSDNIDAFASTIDEINYANNSEVFPNTTNSTALELNSRFGTQFANRLLLGLNVVSDDRDYAGDPFPAVTIEDGSGEIALGSEAFSTGNILEQTIFSVTNNLNWFLGEHTLTFGASFEYFDIMNLFIRQNFGAYTYGSVDDFLQSVCAAGTGASQYCQDLGPVAPARPLSFNRGFSLVDDLIGDESNASAAFNAYQVGFYAQDEFQATDRLRLTAGIRVDIPKITTKPRFADDADQTLAAIVAEGYDLEGAQPGETPKAQPYIAPRLGFNYDLAGDQTLQLRGGLGIFTGRVPFVYPGAMYTNNGVTTGFVSGTLLENGDPIPFVPNPENGLTAEDFGLDPIPNGELDLFTEDFKYPQVFRTSLGLDAQLPYGFLGTLEAQYTKNMSNIVVTNINLREQNAQLNGPDNRRVYYYGWNSTFNSINQSASLIDPRYGGGIYKVGSTSEGYAYDLTASLQRTFFGEDLSTRLSYTYGDSKSLNDATSDQIQSTWRFNENVHGNNFLELARSDWSIGHRVLAMATYRKEFLGNLGTTISAIYTGESGRPYSFQIGSNIGFTGEGSGTAPLAFIPENGSDLTFEDWTTGGVTYTAAEQAAAFEEFIANNEYLNSRRGQYAERNAQRTPFEHVVDVRLAQEIFADIGGRRNSIEATLDIFNFTNLLNRSWGVRYNPGFRTVDLLTFRRFVSEDDLTPVYRFPMISQRGEGDEVGVENMDEYWERRVLDFGSYGSRWLMQFGLRYSF
ncbi:MAG TPA: TonB-dependent receptor [Longimicrobiales bacterium]|nr:TonB-dependent receptor [Longimicrobiales bacterium]